MTFDFSQGVAHNCTARKTGCRDWADMTPTAILPAYRKEWRGTGHEPQPQRWGMCCREPRQVLAPPQGRDARVDVEYRVDRQRPLDARRDQEVVR